MMQIQVTGKNIEIGEALAQYVREKLAGAVEKYFDRDGEAHVTFGKERAVFHAECTVHLSSGSLLAARGESDDAHRAFDIALDHLEKRVRRYTRRLKNHHERGRAVPSGPQ